MRLRPLPLPLPLSHAHPTSADVYNMCVGTRHCRGSPPTQRTERSPRRWARCHPRRHLPSPWLSSPLSRSPACRPRPPPADAGSSCILRLQARRARRGAQLSRQMLCCAWSGPLRPEVFEGNRITVNPPAAPIKSRTITFRFGGISMGKTRPGALPLSFHLTDALSGEGASKVFYNCSSPHRSSHATKTKIPPR